MTGPIKTKVLIADDEQVIANTLVMILNKSGFDARAAYSGEEAVKISATFLPDTLISDIVMGGITGIEAAIKIRSNLPECRILLFSGQAATSGLLHQARVDGHDFEILLKPIHPADLLARLRTHDLATQPD